jgi:hypothetical protein
VKQILLVLFFLVFLNGFVFSTQVIVEDFESGNKNNWIDGNFDVMQSASIIGEYSAPDYVLEVTGLAYNGDFSGKAVRSYPSFSSDWEVLSYYDNNFSDVNVDAVSVFLKVDGNSTEPVGRVYAMCRDSFTGLLEQGNYFTFEDVEGDSLCYFTGASRGSYEFDCGGLEKGDWFKVEFVFEGSQFTGNVYNLSNQVVFSETIDSGYDEFCSSFETVSIQSYATSTGYSDVYFDDFVYTYTPVVTGGGNNYGGGFIDLNTPIITSSGNCVLLFSFFGFPITNCNSWLVFVVLILGVLFYSNRKKIKKWLR